MNNQKLAFYILSSMTAAAIAAMCTVAAMLSRGQQWAIAALTAGVTALASLAPVLRDLWRRRP